MERCSRSTGGFGAPSAAYVMSSVKRDHVVLTHRSSCKRKLPALFNYMDMFSLMSVDEHVHGEEALLEYLGRFAAGVSPTLAAVSCHSLRCFCQKAAPCSRSASPHQNQAGLSATIDEILSSWSRDTSRLRKFSQVWRLLLLSLSTWNKCVTSFFWSSAKNEASASLLMSQCEKTHPQTQNYKLLIHSEMQSDGFSKNVFFTFLNRNNISNI